MTEGPDHPQGTQYPAAPPPGTGRETTVQVWTCGGPNGPTYRYQRPPGQARGHTLWGNVLLPRRPRQDGSHHLGRACGPKGAGGLLQGGAGGEDVVDY